LTHAHTSYPGFEQYAKEYGYESILLSNSSCPPYKNGEMGNNLENLQECRKKIENIYKLINSDLNIEKVILTLRRRYNDELVGHYIAMSGRDRICERPV
jgi:Mg2+ and Co2+ transporter CorA